VVVEDDVLCGFVLDDGWFVLCDVVFVFLWFVFVDYLLMRMCIRLFSSFMMLLIGEC